MTSLALAARVDGQPAAAVPLDDRGLAYGDGVFETVLLYRGRPVWWRQHLARLDDGARRLSLQPPPATCWEQDMAELLLQMPRPLPERLVLKLQLTAGSAARGYGRGASATPRRLSRVLPAPEHASDSGIHLRWCTLTLAAQPRLAGLKHLNRLEQVLARSEWTDPAIDEGLLCEAGGGVVSAIAANLFVVRQGVLCTPPVDRAGVAGICRAFLLEQGGAIERPLSVDDVCSADELFICNSVRGILPVCRLEDSRWPIGPVTLGQLARLAAVEPAFARRDPAQGLQS